MLLREWDIFCRNKAFREEISDDASVPYAVPAEPPSTVISLQADVVTDDKASVGYSDGDFPDVLLTAVACLVDQQELSEDAAAAILASWSDGGNQLLRDIYDHFIEFGGVDDFLDMVRLYVKSMTLTQCCWKSHATCYLTILTFVVESRC